MVPASFRLWKDACSYVYFDGRTTQPWVGYFDRYKLRNNICFIVGIFLVENSINKVLAIFDENGKSILTILYSNKLV